MMQEGKKKFDFSPACSRHSIVSKQIQEKGIKARVFNYHENFYSLSAIASVLSPVVLEFVLL